MSKKDITWANTELGKIENLIAAITGKVLSKNDLFDIRKYIVTKSIAYK